MLCFQFNKEQKIACQSWWDETLELYLILKTDHIKLAISYKDREKKGIANYFKHWFKKENRRRRKTCKDYTNKNKRPKSNLRKIVMTKYF